MAGERRKDRNFAGGEFEFLSHWQPGETFDGIPNGEAAIRQTLYQFPIPI